TKWPAKDKNTPRQNVSSECWPHTIAGQKIQDLSAGQSRGTNATVMIASARKCMMRSTSRFVLSIGYIASPTHFGTEIARRGKYQVIAIANANSRYVMANPTMAGERTQRERLCAPPNAHPAPNT